MTEKITTSKNKHLVIGIIILVLSLLLTNCTRDKVTSNGPSVSQFGWQNNIGDLTIYVSMLWHNQGDLGTSANLAAYLNTKDSFVYVTPSATNHSDKMVAYYQVKPVTNDATTEKTVYSVATEVTGVNAAGIQIHQAAVVAFRIGLMCNLLRLVPTIIPPQDLAVWGSRLPFENSINAIIAEVPMPKGGCVPLFNVKKGIGKWVGGA